MNMLGYSQATAASHNYEKKTQIPRDFFCLNMHNLTAETDLD